MGGWVGGWGKIENKDHLSPTETEIGAELGNCFNKTELDHHIEHCSKNLMEQILLLFQVLFQQESVGTLF